jgi:ribonuclease G
LPEWLIERGIGETRAALVDDREIVEARIEVEGVIVAGSVVAARLVGAASRNAVARDETGIEYLLPRGAPGVSEGAKLNIEITRQPIPGDESWKRPLARVTDEESREALPLTGRELIFPAPIGELGQTGWDELIDQARGGLVQFEGGELRISLTPAMTLIDVDGYLDSDELARRGAAEAAKAIRRLDIGGSIGIDLPTAGSKAARQAAGAAIDAVLPQPFERTAVNGFGFVQIVRPRRRPSLMELANDRAGFEARALLRRAALDKPGPKRLVAAPAVLAVIEARRQWVEALQRQVGGAVVLRPAPAVPISGGYAEPL